MSAAASHKALPKLSVSYDTEDDESVSESVRGSPRLWKTSDSSAVSTAPSQSQVERRPPVVLVPRLPLENVKRLSHPQTSPQRRRLQPRQGKQPSFKREDDAAAGVAKALAAGAQGADAEAPAASATKVASLATFGSFKIPEKTDSAAQKENVPDTDAAAVENSPRWWHSIQPDSVRSIRSAPLTGQQGVRSGVAATETDCTSVTHSRSVLEATPRPAGAVEERRAEERRRRKRDIAFGWVSCLVGERALCCLKRPPAGQAQAAA
eukprot:TRINITY_DN13796_c0_g1_i1.p1 TRINITY_DN13796_c0_g1~~TRINITY_DN13796_c0_g1_i1.p1  ORF type:complete len:265 (-),score=44.82 TRINITY_DN13796_c0_g1_i1:149-943(-)